VFLSNQVNDTDNQAHNNQERTHTQKKSIDKLTMVRKKHANNAEN